MNQHSSRSRSARPLRALAIGGTALALVFGGAVLGGSFDLTRSTPAFADPVQIQGIEPFSFADVVETVRPAVVSVRVKSARESVSLNQDDFPFFDLPEGSPMERFFRQFRQQRPNARPRTSLGSGFFISDDGYVVTNNHVIDKEQEVSVVLDDGTEYNATVIGKDDRTDLALLKIDDSGRTFTYVKFADEEPRVGDWVVAVGNPFGLGGTVTAGIISAHGRQIGAGPYDDFLQIDAAVNRGNSGGPAFNFQGEVVGVNTAIFSPSGGNVGIAFAIPASTADRVLTDLLDNGKVVRGWLGVQIQPVTRDIADSLRLDQAEGAVIAEVIKDTPAEEAGFHVGDAILAINGEPVADSREMSLKIAEIDPGESVRISYWRDGARHDVDVVLATMPDEDQLAMTEPTEAAPRAGSTLDDFGLSLAPAEDNQGVVITEVDPDGRAADNGLQAGDVILSVGNALVTAPADVEKMVAEAKSEGQKAILFRIKSGDRARLVALTFARS
jgi:serine protease Do